MSDRSTGTILLGIIAIAGLGLSGFMFVKNEVVFPTSDTGFILVGLWEDVTKDKQNPNMNADNAWLLKVSNEQIIKNEYIVLNTTTVYNNTRFHLVKPGFYRITINIFLIDLLSTQGYAVSAFKDGENYGLSAFKKVFHVVTPNAMEYVNVDFYLESDGTNFYEFGCYTLSAPFNMDTRQEYNHLSIEFVK